MFYLENDFDRPATDEYLGWFQRVARRYRTDRNSDFDVPVTMGDWAVPDFEPETGDRSPPASTRSICEYVYCELLADEGVEWLYRGLDLEQMCVLWYVITDDGPPAPH